MVPEDEIKRFSRQIRGLFTPPPDDSTFSQLPIPNVFQLDSGLSLYRRRSSLFLIKPFMLDSNGTDTEKLFILLLNTRSFSSHKANQSDAYEYRGYSLNSHANRRFACLAFNLSLRKLSATATLTSHSLFIMVSNGPSIDHGAQILLCFKTGPI